MSRRREGADVASRSMRAALRNRDLVRFSIAHVTIELSGGVMKIGALVYAFAINGALATAATSIVLLVARAATAPFAGALVHCRPNRVRLASFTIQATVLGAAAAAALASAPAALVIGPCVIAVAARTFIRPASAVLLPAISRTSRELSVANVWMGYGDGLSLLGSALLATVLLAVEGPALALAGSAALALGSVIVGISHAHVEPPPSADRTEAPTRPIQATVRTLGAMWSVPGTSGVLVVAGGLEVLSGALNILVVVLASEALDLGQPGAGLLSTFVGVGAVLGLPVSTALLRRTRLAPVLLTGLGIVALAAAGLGVLTTLVMAVVLLPILGCSMLVLFLVTRMLLQRSVPPAALGATFGVLELLAGLGRITGAIATQVLIVLAGADGALVGLGVLFALLLVATRRRLRSADDVADVPVVAISLLRRLPEFAPLPETALEAVARGAVEVPVTEGAVVVREGGRGDCFFAVADGYFDVTIHGEPVRTLGRGDGFGEIALLADVPRTATVTARGSGTLYRVEREPFLVAVTGRDSSQEAAWRAIRSLRLTAELREAIPNPD